MQLDDFSLFKYEKCGVVHCISLGFRSENKTEKKGLGEHRVQSGLK